MLNVTPLMRLYSAVRLHKLAQQQVATVQERQLFRLLRTARTSRFGRQYHFNTITNIEEYQRTVPLRTYDDFWQEFWGDAFPNLFDCTWPGKIPFFGISTGTTDGRAKYLPVSRAMIASNKRGSFDLFCHHLAGNPHSKLLGGKGLMIGGFASLEELAPGVYASLLPIILLTKTMPWWVRPWYLTTTASAAESSGWEDKLHRLARETLRHDIRSLSGFPPRLLAFFQALKDEKPAGDEFRIADYFPRLEMITHGGVSLTPYQTQFTNMLAGSHCELREIYPSTEGFLAIADRQPGQGLRLICDHGIFYEFIPLEEFHCSNPSRYWIANVKTGVEYAVVLSTCAGLWSYLLGDVIQFVDLNPPRILITGRTSQTISISGEKFMEADFNRAIAAAADTIGAIVNEFTVGAALPQHVGDRGKYRYIVEFQQPPAHQEDVRTFCKAVEHTLRRHNSVYDVAYLEGRGIEPPDLYIAAPGTFAAWLRQRGTPDAKIPRIIAAPEQFAAVFAFAQTWNG